MKWNTKEGVERNDDKKEEAESQVSWNDKF